MKYVAFLITVILALTVVVVMAGDNDCKNEKCEALCKQTYPGGFLKNAATYYFCNPRDDRCDCLYFDGAGFGYKCLTSCYGYSDINAVASRLLQRIN
ncbi:hypothetical protein [Trichoplusia ni ascovirus 6b]|nr:hypothetical protein [Trichoplusia ni ascovirus 6b]